MKLILHIDTLADAPLALRTAMAMEEHKLIGCAYTGGQSFSAIRRGKTGTITVYQQPLTKMRKRMHR